MEVAGKRLGHPVAMRRRGSTATTRGRRVVSNRASETATPVRALTLDVAVPVRRSPLARLTPRWRPARTARALGARQGRVAGRPGAVADLALADLALAGTVAAGVARDAVVAGTRSDGGGPRPVRDARGESVPARQRLASGWRHLVGC